VTDRVEYPSVDGLIVEPDGAVVRVRLDRPDRRNALTDETVDALIDAIEAAGNDEQVRVIALSGNGDDFCSGFDMGTRGRPATKPRVGSTQRQLRGGVNRLIPTMLETQTPIVTAATGHIIGFGLSIVLASDFAIVADGARLRAPFTAMGFTPDSGASWLIPRLVGVARAKELLLLGREISGARAAEWGLVHRAAPIDEVAGEAATLVTELASAATVAVGLAKLLVHRGLTLDLEHQLADEALAIELSSRSDDFKEYAKARRDRRDPDFTGR
jgi:2-(1,2-epoxy-1,2-dihydrophenyl)acetyl-CoA isomerase